MGTLEYSLTELNDLGERRTCVSPSPGFGTSVYLKTTRFGTRVLRNREPARSTGNPRRYIIGSGNVSSRQRTVRVLAFFRVPALQMSLGARRGVRAESAPRTVQANPADDNSQNHAPRQRFTQHRTATLRDRGAPSIGMCRPGRRTYSMYPVNTEPNKLINTKKKSTRTS
jgi:hypothetical protein